MSASIAAAHFAGNSLKAEHHTSGIYLCSKCGVEGPLNIEIQKTKSLETDSEKKE